MLPLPYTELRKSLRKSFSTALKKSDINGFRFHGLRHTFVLQLIMSGADLNKQRAVDVPGRLIVAVLPPEQFLAIKIKAFELANI